MISPIFGPDGYPVTSATRFGPPTTADEWIAQLPGFNGQPLPPHVYWLLRDIYRGAYPDPADSKFVRACAVITAQHRRIRRLRAEVTKWCELNRRRKIPITTPNPNDM